LAFKYFECYDIELPFNKPEPEKDALIEKAYQFYHENRKSQEKDGRKVYENEIAVKV
jgi:hypothetical protein